MQERGKEEVETHTKTSEASQQQKKRHVLSKETHTNTSEASQQKEPVEGFRAPGSSSRKRDMYLVSKHTQIRWCEITTRPAE